MTATAWIKLTCDVCGRVHFAPASRAYKARNHAAGLRWRHWTETGPRGGQTERDACPTCPTPKETNRA